ncbi:MAG: TetR/AcrR family transcriptional regulator [Cardiobacteriaceae bacterium]|nr:TetR/AcrR family transcriptional regulator [Cardiobacteriaceae bacterium]
MSNHPKEDAREAFLAAGRTLYLQCGYSGLSIRSLAAQAGLSSGMFHHLFTNKDAFVAEVLQRKYDEAFTQLQSKIQIRQNVRENLHQVMTFLAFFVRDHLDWVTYIFADALTGVKPVRHLVKEYAGMRHVSLMIELLLKADRQGSLKPASLSQRIIFLMTSVTAPMLIGSQLQKANLLPDMLAAQFLPDVASDEAIKQRIDWALSALFIEEHT